MKDTASVTQPPTVGAGQGLWVRQSSGLVRELGTLDSFIIAFAIIQITAIYSLLAPGMAVTSGGDFTLPLIAAFGLAVPVGLLYSQLTTIFPRSGGDYVYSSRVIHPFLGAAVGGALLMNLYRNLGVNGAQYFAQVNVPFVVSTVGSALNLPSLANVSTFLSGNTPSFVIGAASLVILGAVAMLRLSTVVKVVFWATIVSVVAFIWNAVVISIHSPSDFATAFNAAAGHPNAYANIIAAAHQNGLPTGVNLGAIVTLFSFAFVLPNNFWYPALSGAEIKKPQRTFTLGALAALGVSAILAIFAWLGMRHSVGIDFAQAAPWLFQNHPDLYAKFSSDNPLNGGFEYGPYLASDPISQIVMSLNLPASTVAINLAYLALGSRIVFALSFDRLLPERLAKVNPRTHTPVAAVILSIVVAVIWLGFGIYGSSYVAIFRNGALVTFLIALVTALVGIVLPYVRKELWQASPKVAGAKWFGIPSLTAISILPVISMAGGALLIATQPNIAWSFATISAVVVVLLFGVVLYGVAWLRTRNRGIDLNLAMRQLPPE